MPQHAYLDHPYPIPFAHRGGAATGVENALSAFAEVQRLGYRYVETDVRTTADGVPVVFHDGHVGRLTGADGRISALPLPAVRSLALAGGERIATLEEVLGSFPDLRFNIDLKDEGGVLGVPPVLRRTAASDRVCVTSFAERRIRRVRRRLDPAVCTGLGVGGVALLLAGGLVGRPYCRAAGVLQVPWSLGGGRTLPARVVHIGHAARLAVHVWTVDDPGQMRAALDMGVDGVMTDQPGLLRDVLIDRGQWA